MQIEFTASNEVMEALASVGQTEDVKFSPDNRRLALAGFSENKCLVVDIQFEISPSCKKVLLNDFIEITSPCLKDPHGIDFIDQNTLIVANRSASVPILKLPPSGMEKKKFSLSPLQTIRGSVFHPVESPGSVSVSPFDHDLYEVLICNNYLNRVTRHYLDASEQFRILSNQILLQKRLDVPDGIAMNKKQRWIAVSNHNTQCVLLFENREKLNRWSEPAGILRDVSFPHGVCFTPDDKFVLVADGGEPFVHVFARGDTSWHGIHKPLTSVRVVDAETFLLDRQNEQEGGPKGIDIDSEMNVLVTTCKHQTLAFFDLPAVLNSSQPPFSTSIPE